MKCKTCGKEIPTGEFDFWFKSEPRDCEGCLNLKRAEDQKLSDEQIAKNPDWHGPVNQEEVF